MKDEAKKWDFLHIWNVVIVALSIHQKSHGMYAINAASRFSLDTIYPG